MAKTTVSKPSKNSSKNISLKVPQLATKTKTIEPDVSCNSTGSSYMEAAKTTVGKKRKNSTRSTPEISSHGTWSPYMDGIVGTPKSVAEIDIKQCIVYAAIILRFGKEGEEVWS
ncbi:hypothetical protein OIU85_008637 [Salix viminalis]|uniref:Uncharacterized protein n=1 Tax=Salix viminalis TaxID=40686 RepID=A0A9Q0NY60_SALVM|nr:hypothetical protein OIU85_008637 [Salix viminalis]